MYKISLNGLDGSGKTTQCQNLIKRFPFGFLSKDIGNYKVFPNLNEDDFFRWWFFNSDIDTFCDMIYRGIRHRDDEATKRGKQLIINDKGIFTFDCRILANFLLRGYDYSDIYNRINLSKKKYEIIGDDLSLFLDIEDRTILKDRIDQRNNTKINSYDDYYHKYQKKLKEVTENMLHSYDIKIIDATDDINNIFNKILANIINKKQQFIFISGVSESGKSTASEYLTQVLPNSIHVKMRDILDEMYINSGSILEKDLWMKEQEENNSYNFWFDFILLTSSHAFNNDYIILDTLHGINAIKNIYKILNDNVNLIYIEASLNNRVYREYIKLRKNSNITIDEVANLVRIKDKSKEKMGSSHLKELSIYNDELLIDQDCLYTPFTYVVNNDGNIENFKNQLINVSQDIRYKYRGKTKCIKRI